MIKLNFFVILFFFSFKLVSQINLKNTNTQLKYFNEANTELNKEHISVALILFDFAYELIPENEIGKNSIKKIDSLKPILREKLKRDWKGTWELKEIINNKKKYLKITDSEIKFYEEDVNSYIPVLVRTEKIIFNEVKYHFYTSYWELIFSDGYLYNFSLISNKLLKVTKSNKIGDYSIEHYPIYRDKFKHKYKMKKEIVYKRVNKTFIN